LEDFLRSQLNYVYKNWVLGGVLMARPMFALITLLLILSTPTWANITLYDSHGSKKILAQQFPSATDNKLDFNSRDQKILIQNLEDIKKFLMESKDLPFEKNHDSVHSLHLQQLTRISMNTVAIRFTYDLDFSHFSSLLPERVPLVSKNILVRVNDGYIESISTGLDKKFTKRALDKLNSFKRLVVDSINKEKVKNSVANFSNFLKREDGPYYQYLLRVIESNKIKFISFLNKKVTAINHQINDDISFSTIIESFKSLLSSVQNCGMNCYKDQLYRFLDKLRIDKESLRTWANEQMVNEYEFYKIFFTHLIKRDSVYFHLDNKNNLHLIAELSELDGLKVDIRFASDGITFQRAKQFSHLNPFKLMDTEEAMSTTGIWVPDDKTTVFSPEDYPRLRDNLRGADLDSVDPRDFIALQLLNNQKYYNDYFGFKRKSYKQDIYGQESDESDDKDTQTIDVHYNITKPMGRADNATWFYSPVGKFFIGAGGVKFKNLWRSSSILGHEFFHSVEENLSHLYSSNESGALKEHGADIMGTIIAESLEANLDNNLDKKPIFAVGCDIFTDVAREKYKQKHPQFDSKSESSTPFPICLRNFLSPSDSYAPVATTKQSIIDFLGDNYSTECVDTIDNDDCGVHFQSSIPNLVVARFMKLTKKSVPVLSWNDVRELTAKIIYYTYAGRLQNDAGFLNYGQNLKLECLEQTKKYSKIEKNIANEICDSLESRFIEILK